MLLTLSHYAIR
jgi:transcriptional regulator with XRE-family HTH domain